MSHYPQNLPFGPLYKGLPADPAAKHIKRLGPAVWLLMYLIASAHVKTGKLVTTFSSIATQMGISEATVCSWLGHLRKWQYVSIQKEGQEVRFRIARWKTFPGEIVPHTTTAAENRGAKPRYPEFALKRPLTVEKAQILAQRIAEDFGEQKNLHYIFAVCKQYPPLIIKEAFTKVAAMPAERIRKSRSALFVYLAKKYAQENK